jgi:hypothetical protein
MQSGVLWVGFRSGVWIHCGRVPGWDALDMGSDWGVKGLELG